MHKYLQKMTVVIENNFSWHETQIKSYVPLLKTSLKEKEKSLTQWDSKIKPRLHLYVVIICFIVQHKESFLEEAKFAFSSDCKTQMWSSDQIYFLLQNIFHAVVEVPRWTNAKMEVKIFTVCLWISPALEHITENHSFFKCYDGIQRLWLSKTKHRNDNNKREKKKWSVITHAEEWTDLMSDSQYVIRVISLWETFTFPSRGLFTHKHIIPVKDV